MVPRYSSSSGWTNRWLGSLSTRYRRRVATNSSRNPPSESFKNVTRPRGMAGGSDKSDAPRDQQPYYSGEERYGLEQQRERPAKTCHKRMSVPSVAVSIGQKSRGGEKGISQPAPLLQSRLCQEQ